MITTYERGKAEGKLENSREILLLQLEAKFGALAPAVKERVAALSAERVRQLLLDVVKSQSLDELHLQD